MELYLMQHGASLRKEIDPDQGLSPVGREQVEKTGQALAKMGLDFDLILASPKKRSIQSAAVIAEAVGYPLNKILASDSVKPMAPPRELLNLLEENRTRESVFIAGHLPSLNELTSLLITPESKASVQFENSGAARIDIQDFTRPSGTLVWRLTPFQLQLLASV